MTRLDPAVVDIIRYGIAGDTERCKAYAQLLLERLEEQGDDIAATAVRSVLSPRLDAVKLRLAGQEGSMG